MFGSITTGKDTVQNMLALRFANAIFSRSGTGPVDRSDRRRPSASHPGRFYEHAGATRDIPQNHVLQVLPGADGAAGLVRPKRSATRVAAATIRPPTG